MNSGINLSAVYIADIIGMLIAFIMYAGNTLKLRNRDRENRNIKDMLMIIISACVADMMVFTFDGVQGAAAGFVVYLGNFWLFFTNILISPLWVSVIVRHIKGRVPSKLKYFIVSLCGIGTLMLFVNFFVPVVYSIDSYNVYSRGPAFWFYMIVDIIIVMSGVLVYLDSAVKGEVMKFFPVWQFLLPLVAGALIQGVFYGVSALWPCVAVSVVSIINSLHNEATYLDRLTGLYNRFYLDNEKNEIMNRKNGRITAMMLDMNDFKSINDNFGHAAGDEALIIAADILKNSVSPYGKAIRYAGDEFVILLNTQQDDIVKGCVSTIKSEIENFNINNNKPYNLSLSIGYCGLDLKNQTIDELLNEVDKRMYEDKKRFYESNPARNRRQEIREFSD